MDLCYRQARDGQFLRFDADGATSLQAGHPAEVLEVKSHNDYCIRFDGFVEEYDRPKDELRVLKQGNAKQGGGATARRPPSTEVKAAPAPASAPPFVDSKHKEGSSDGKHGSTFKNNDRVEALWLEDGKWYPAEVIQVKSHNFYRIRFDGFVEEYDRSKIDLWVLEQGGAKSGGGAAASGPC